MFFSVITKNLNWETLTKNLVIFQRWDGLRLNIFNIMGVHWKNQLLGGGGGRGQFSDLRGGLTKGVGNFQGGLIIQCTLWRQHIPNMIIM